MLLSMLSNGSGDIKGYLISFLLILPALLIGLCGHECAHAFIAYKCGDPTAKMMGRMTMDPRKHLDPLGSLMLLLIGFGWAKPVPVDPRNFRHYRRDDFFVSIAGIVYNLCVFLITMILMSACLIVAIHSAPEASNRFFAPDAALYIAPYNGENVLFSDIDGALYYLTFRDAFTNALGMGTYLILPLFGKTAMYAYDMLIYMGIVNLSLAVFNLLPVPPLDGYHVLNDLVLKKSLFAPEKLARITSGVLMALILIGNFNEKFDVLGMLLGAVRTFAFETAGNGLYALASLFGLI